MNGRLRGGVLTVAVLLACGGDPPPAESPEYAREAPSYTTREGEESAGGLRFTDIAPDAGIDFVHETGAFGAKWMPETTGSGGAFVDYDGDGWLDVMLVNGAAWPGREPAAPLATSRLYRNLGDGRFEDVTAATGLSFSRYGMGVAIADYDADGDADIYLTAVGDNVLLRNDGGRFTDVTVPTGTHGNTAGDAASWSTAAAWFDADGDDWLDLFVCNYVRWTPETDLFTTLDGTTKSYATPQQYEGDSCVLYRNIGGERFDDVTTRAGLANPEGKTLGIAVEDFNDDGWLDVVVANDTYRNFLYLSDGDGSFTDVALRAGVALDEFGRARAGMGIDVADVANDGRLAIVIGNFAREPLSLYTQIGNGLFQDRAGAARLTRPSLLALTFGTVFADFDLDGDLDLAAANGHIEPEINRVQQDVTFAQPPMLFVNDGSGRFTDVSNAVGDAFGQPMVARGLATGDIDRDGDPDLLVTVNGGPARLFRTDLPHAPHWIGFRLRHPAPNRQAIGAVVRVFAGEVAQRRMVRTGSSYLSQSETDVIRFGLGAAVAVDSIVVEWPGRDRRRSVFGITAADRVYRVEPGADRIVPDSGE